MAEFEIRINQVKSSVESEKRIAEKIASAEQELTECQNALDTSVSRQYAAVKRNLSGLSRRLSLEKEHMRGMAQALESIYGTYQKTESEITGRTISNTKVQEAKSYESPVLNNPQLEAEDILSFFSKLIKGLTGSGDSDLAKVMSSFLSTYAKGLKMSDSDNIAEWFTAFVGFSGGMMGLGSKVGNSISSLIGKYGTPALKSWFEKNGSTFSSEMGALGTIGSAFGFSNSYLKAIQDSDSFADFLKKSDGWLSSGVGLVSDLAGKGKEFTQTTGNPVASLLSMGSYLAGDIIDLSTDGHPMTPDELSHLLLGGGMTGVKTGVSQLTCGIVDIDVDRSIGIFDKNVAWTTDKIASTGIAIEGQVALGIVATPVVAVWSVGETIFDFGYQIGEGINNGIQSICNFFAGENKTAAGGAGGGGGAW